MFWLKMTIGTLFHPISVFRTIKYNREKFSWWPFIIILFSMFVARIASIYLLHFPVARINSEDTNIIIEVVKTIVPVVSWGIMSFAITAIWNGECHLRESLTGAAFAIVPYVVLCVPIALISRMLDANSIAFLTAMNTMMWVWVVFLFFLCMMYMNSYSFVETIKVCGVTLIGVVVFWAIVLLLFVLTYQFIDFIKTVLLEIRLKYAG